MNVNIEDGQEVLQPKVEITDLADKKLGDWADRVIINDTTGWRRHEFLTALRGNPLAMLQFNTC